jgi:hypothetical protein
VARTDADPQKGPSVSSGLFNTVAVPRARSNARKLCNTGENERSLRRELYTQNGQGRTPKTVETYAVSADGVRPFRVAEQSLRPIRTGEGVERGGVVEAKAECSVLIGESKLQRGRAAAEEIIHAPDQR